MKMVAGPCAPAHPPGCPIPENPTPAPVLGEHTRGVLAELDFDAESVESLLQAGAAIAAKSKTEESNSR